MSVPMEMTAAAFSVASRSSGRMAEKSVVAAFVRKPEEMVYEFTQSECQGHRPICLTTLAYARLSTMIFASSGKCHPYHSYSTLAPNLGDRRVAYLDAHSVDVDFLVQVVEQCDGLYNHRVHFIWREFDFKASRKDSQFTSIMARSNNKGMLTDLDYGSTPAASYSSLSHRHHPRAH